MRYLARTVKDVNKYIKNKRCLYAEDENIITVEHRSNNPKRDYLFVNKKQCKHIPASPSEMIEMCRRLASLVSETVDKKSKIVVIAFAETATAIGNFVADSLENNNVYVMQTTRENLENSCKVIDFQETHSHATNQQLLTWANADELDRADYILFVEDEVSTGKTILNFIEQFEKKYHNKRYGVASICNWMSKGNLSKFYDRDIDVMSLISGCIEDENMKMDLVRTRDNLRIVKVDTHENPFLNERLGHENLQHIKADLINKINDMLREIEWHEKINSIRVIGTEEFMYIPIRVGKYLEEHEYEVVCHSTTRSPIDVITGHSYGSADAITCKNSVSSLYDSSRTTYIYNLNEQTDMTILITDAPYNTETLRIIKEQYAGLLLNTSRYCLVCFYN